MEPPHSLSLSLRHRWDGLVRLVFNRKNKTLRASLTTKTVLELLDRNFRTLASLAGKVSWRRGPQLPTP